MIEQVKPQAAEKYLKAHMTFRKMEFPFIHNLEKLVEFHLGTGSDIS